MHQVIMIFRPFLFACMIFFIVTIGLHAQLEMPIGNPQQRLEPSNFDFPFECNPDMYLTRAENWGKKSNLFEVVRTTSQFLFDPIGSVQSGNSTTDHPTYNALAYNPLDDLLYGVGTKTNTNNDNIVYRINSNGDVSEICCDASGNPLTVPRNVSVPNNPGVFSATFTRDGDYIFFNSRDKQFGKIKGLNYGFGGTGYGPDLQNITVTYPVVQISTAFSDMAFNPVDDKIWAYQKNKLLRFDPNNLGSPTVLSFNSIDLSNYSGGSVSNISTNNSPTQLNMGAGSQFFDALGNFYLVGTSDVAGDNLQKHLWHVDVTTGTLTWLQDSGTNVTLVDGASCPFNLAMEKDVTPRQASAGDTVTYTFKISNQTDLDLIGTTFSDTLPQGMSIASVNSLCGGSTSFSGNQLSITNLIINAHTVCEIQAQVQITSSVSIGEVCNQSSLTDIPGAPGGTELLSDDVTAPGFPAETCMDVVTKGSAEEMTDLELQKQLHGELVHGQSAEYELSVNVLGPQSLTGNLFIVDHIPAGLNFIGFSPNSLWDCHPAPIQAGPTNIKCAFLGNPPSSVPTTLPSLIIEVKVWAEGQFEADIITNCADVFQEDIFGNVIPEVITQNNSSCTEDAVSSKGEPQPRPRPPLLGDDPDEMVIALALDLNNNNRIDDSEIQKAIQYWILGLEVPGTDGFKIDDEQMKTLIQFWISGNEIQAQSAVTSEFLNQKPSRFAFVNKSVDEYAIQTDGSFGPRWRIKLYDLSEKYLFHLMILADYA